MKLYVLNCYEPDCKSLAVTKAEDKKRAISNVRRLHRWSSVFVRGVGDVVRCVRHRGAQGRPLKNSSK